MIIDVSIENPRHLSEILKTAGVSGVILPGDRLDHGEWKPVAERIRAAGKKAYFSLPRVMRLEAEKYYRLHTGELRDAGFDGWLVPSIDGAAFLMEADLPGERIFDQGMYVWNRRADAMMRDLGADVVTLPYECRREELEDRGFADAELVIYGKLPVMISAQCTGKTGGACRLMSGKSRDEAAKMVEFRSLRDRKKAEFAEDSHCRFCYSVIYNSVPLWLVDRVPAPCARVRFSFTDEAIGVPAQILADCITKDGDLRKAEPRGAFTRGHLKRGVE